MSTLTTDEKVFLIECFFSRGKVYSKAFRGFRTKFGTKKVASESTLRRVIDNFIKYGTVQDRRHDLSGPSISVAIEEKVNEVEQYFKENPNITIRKAAEELKLSKSTLHRILQVFLKMHPYKISTHQLSTKQIMLKRCKFCEVMTRMFETEELNEKTIIFVDEVHFYINGYVNKQNCRFWGSENPVVSQAKPLHPQKVTVWVAISVKGIYLHFFESTVTDESYRDLLETKYFPYAKKRGLVNNFYLMQDGTAPHRTRELFEAIHKVYGERVIGLGYPKFILGGGMEWPPYSPDLNPCDFFLWGYIKDHCYTDNPKTKEKLIYNIKKTVHGIYNETLEHVFHSFRKRLDICSNSNGLHFANIYH